MTIQSVTDLDANLHEWLVGLENLRETHYIIMGLNTYLYYKILVVSKSGNPNIQLPLNYYGFYVELDVELDDNELIFKTL